MPAGDVATAAEHGIEVVHTGCLFRHLDNVLATPRLGYVTEGLYRTFYGDSVRNVADWLDRQASSSPHGAAQ